MHFTTGHVWAYNFCLLPITACQWKTTKHCQATWRQKMLEFELCIQDRVDLDGWFQEVRSAHLVLLVAFAGMQPLEVFCTSYPLMVFLNRFDGNKASFLAGLPNDSCFLFAGIFVSATNHQSHSSKSQSSLTKGRARSATLEIIHPDRHDPECTIQIQAPSDVTLLDNALRFCIGMQLWHHFGIEASYVYPVYSYRDITIT